MDMLSIKHLLTIKWRNQVRGKERSGREIKSNWEETAHETEGKLVDCKVQEAKGGKYVKQERLISVSNAEERPSKVRAQTSLDSKTQKI